jgi:hypothetical protein
VGSLLSGAGNLIKPAITTPAPAPPNPQEAAIASGSAAGPPAPNGGAPLPDSPGTLQMVSSLTNLVGHASATAGTTKQSLAQHILQTGFEEITSIATMITAIATIVGVHPFGFSGGGIVPSAAGGMVTPSGSGGMLAILHPNEMVLPADVTAKVLGRSGGGDTHNYHINVNHSVSAIDASSFNSFAKEHYDSIMEAVEHGVRNAHPSADRIFKGRS